MIWFAIVAYFPLSQISITYLSSLLLKLTRAPLGYSAERAPLGGGGADSAPLPNSRTNRRSEAGEAAIESPEREDSNAY